MHSVEVASHIADYDCHSARLAPGTFDIPRKETRGLAHLLNSLFLTPSEHIRHLVLRSDSLQSLLYNQPVLSHYQACRSRARLTRMSSVIHPPFYIPEKIHRPPPLSAPPSYRPSVSNNINAGHVGEALPQTRHTDIAANLFGSTISAIAQALPESSASEPFYAWGVFGSNHIIPTLIVLQLR